MKIPALFWMFGLPLLILFGLTCYLYGIGWMIAEIAGIMFLLFWYAFAGEPETSGDRVPSPTGKNYFHLWEARRSHRFYENGKNYNHYLDHFDFAVAKIKESLAEQGKTWSNDQVEQVADYIARQITNGLPIIPEEYRK